MARNRRALAERTRISRSQCVGSSSKRGRRRRTGWPYPTRGRAARAKRSGQARAGARGNARAHATGRRRSRAGSQRQSRSPEDGNRDCGIAPEVLSRFDVKLIFTNSASASGSPAASGDRQRGIVARQPERLRRASHIHARLPHARRLGAYSSSEISASDTSLR